MNITLVLGANFVSDDGTSVFVKEGDMVDKVIYYEDGKTNTLTGALRVMNVSTKAYSSGPSTCPPEPFFSTIAKLNAIIFDISDEYDAKLKSINVSDIISISVLKDGDVVVDPNEASVTEILEEVVDGATISIQEGEVAEALTVDKDVIIEGSNSGIPQNFYQEI